MVEHDEECMKGFSFWGVTISSLMHGHISKELVSIT